jgi:hydroxylaminobenzene mutase
MSVRAVLEGALIGLGMAFILAVILALIDYQWAIPAGIQRGAIWAGAGITAGVCGIAGGRLAATASWFHGALAAVTLNLVATVVAETAHVTSVTHVWAGLGLAAGVGLVGGLIGAATL